MDLRFRRDLIAWLAADATLAASCNTIGEEHPPAPSPPALAIAAQAGGEWGAKGAPGRAIRIALELRLRDDDPDAAALLAEAVERRIATLPPDQGTYRVVVTQFVRSRAERRAGNLRAVLIEYRFLVLSRPD